MSADVPSLLAQLQDTREGDQRVRLDAKLEALLRGVA